MSDLSGIEFKLTAKEDIIDYADGSKIYSKGQEVKTYNLEKNGCLKVESLPMGTYELEETKTLNGLVLNDKKYEIKFEQEDLIKKVYEVNEDISNDTTIFEFSKKDITGDNELEGAELSVIDENDNIIDTWTSTENTHKIEGLVVGKTYKLREEISPDGYVKATTIEFKVENTTEVQKVEMIDKIVEISKQDVAGTELEGATLVVTNNKTKNIVDKWVSGKEPHKVSGLIEGEIYNLHEEIVVDGYVKASDIQFEVTYGKETQHIVMIDKIVTMSKVDIGGKEIEGAEIVVTDKDGNEIDSWISEKEAHIIKGLEEGKTYILHEKVAADGYVKASDIEFTVSMEKENEHIEMIDKIVKIVKTDLVTGDEIEGAKLQVIDENGNIIDEWTSTKEPHIVNGLEENQKYKLVEITAPYGYELTEEIEFVVTTNKETQLVEMKDMPILKNIKLNKIDSQTKEIIKEKFSFGIYEDEECNNLIKEVKSSKADGYVVFEDLRYGTYYIKETKSPSGYELSDKIVKLEINDNGVFVDGTLIEEKDSVYGFEFENTEIEVPNTGDSRYTKILIFIGGISAISLIGIVVYDYKKRKNKV